MSRRFIKDYLMLLTGGVLLQFCGLIYRLILARQLGPEPLGLTGMVFPLYRFLCIVATLGLAPTLTRMAALHQENALTTETAYHRLILRFASFLGLGLVLAAPVLSRYVYPDPRVLPLFYLMAPALPLTALAVAYRASLQGHERIGKLIMAEWVELVVDTGFVLAAISSWSFPSSQVAKVLLIGFGLSEAASIFYLNRSWRQVRANAVLLGENPPPATLKLGQGLRRSLPILLNQFMITASAMAEGWIIPQRLVVSGLSVAAATPAVGQLWGMIFPVVFLPSILMTPLAPLVLPRSARWNQRSDWSHIRRLLIKLFLTTGILGICSALVLTRTAGSVTSFLYPGANIARDVQLWAPVIPFVFIDFPATVVLQGLGKYRTLAGITFISVIVRTALVFLLTGDPALQLHGTRYAIIFSEALSTILSLAAIITYLCRKQKH